MQYNATTDHEERKALKERLDRGMEQARRGDTVDGETFLRDSIDRLKAQSGACSMEDEPDLEASLRLSHDAVAALDDIIIHHRALRERLFFAANELEQGKRAVSTTVIKSMYDEHPDLADRLDRRS